VKFKKNEKQILFYIYKIGIIQRDLFENYHDESLNGNTKLIIDKLLNDKILVENNIEGIPHLIISREFDPIVRNEYENHIFRWTRGTKEIVTLINSCMGSKS